MIFKAWYFLFFLLLLPFLHRYWMKRNKPTPVFYSVQIPKNISRKNPTLGLHLLKYLCFSFFIFALARPQSSFRQMNRTVSGIDIMMVLDVSDSMNIEDLSEKSRLDVAKETMEQFVKGRANDRIGFVIFSGEPLTLVPPTLDYNLVLKSIHDVEIGHLKQGTAIGDGLSLAVHRLKTSRAKSRVVILLTDGENNVGQVDPATAGELAAGFGIRVYTIAIGKEGRVFLPIKRKVFGREVIEKVPMENQLNVELLQLISKTTGAKFFRVTDASTLDSVFSEIDHLEKSEIKGIEKVKYDDLFQFPLKLGILVLMLEQVLELIVWRLLL